MAHRKESYAVGDIVYLPFKAQKPGKVVKVRIGTMYHNKQAQMATVRFIDGTTEEVPSFHLADFLSLIADHEKKLRTHAVALEKAKSLDG